ncbi:hypothetical protein PISMIDRAFT_326515 [Pisolithus microcarpus 441]|uniref:Uncharacterized protein n=1 Tax=Pisolithus microcarpus 441 TaxID=765257 RepID=A0A0C9YLH9_9AGAM|nr:hypothetical protein BKA83DRAFT_326515 [Pisolithus microcarpus]KIK25855.1 hypothetical protein PISMIDRAFT_326515 [Pisolithus microcarpus 441]
MIFVHVFGWTVLRYLPSPMDGHRRKELVSLLYDREFRTATGQEEWDVARQISWYWGILSRECFPIFELMQTFASPVQARYRRQTTH